MYIRVLPVIAILWLLAAVPTRAQEYIADVQQYGIAEGLSHREVNAIIQDSRGFIWLGTPLGLNRFDGSEFRWWTKEKDGLPDNDIAGLLEDAEGDLWISSEHSKYAEQGLSALSFLNIKTGKLRSVAEKFNGPLPVPLDEIGANWCADARKTVYLGTLKAARMITWRPGAGFRIFPLPGYRSFKPMTVTAQNTLWGIADDQVWLEIDQAGKILQTQRENVTLSDNRFFLTPDALNYEISSDGQPLCFLQIGKSGRKPLDISRFPIPVDSLNGIVKSLVYNPHNRNLWVFSKNYLAVVHPDEGLLLNLYAQYPELQKDRNFGYRGVAIDASGALWLGGDFGVYKVNIRRSRFRRYLYTPEDKPGHKNNAGEAYATIGCRGIYENGADLYIGTERNGLQHFPAIQQPGPPKDGAAVLIPHSDKVYALSAGRENDLWIGSRQLYRYDFASGALTTIENRDSNDAKTIIRAIFVDKNSNVWLGPAGGLQRKDRAKTWVEPFEQYNTFHELAKTPVHYIGEDRQGTIWLCTQAGLYTLDREKGITARYWSGGQGAHFLPCDHLNYLYHDTAGIYWLGTTGGGLIKWDKNRAIARQFTRAEGLPNNTIYAIYADKHQNLWMSSDYGIIQFDKNSGLSKTWLPEDGATHYEFNRASHFQSKDGWIYFGGLNGVTAFQPDDFYEKDNFVYPKLEITGFQQFDGATNRLIDKTGDLLSTNRITLQPGDRFFQLDFALLSYEAVDQIRYVCKVEGVDNDWTALQGPSIRMSRLPYGNHLLKIKAQAANGLWSENTLEIAVAVRKPIYLQGWFLFVPALLLFGLAIGFYKWRTWQYKQNQRRLEREVARQTATIRQQSEELRHLDQIKSRFFTNISHEIRTPLTVIKGMAGEIEGNEQAKKLIDRNADNLLRLINQLLDLSKLDSGAMKLNRTQADIVQYLQYLTESFYSLAEEKKIRLTFYSETPELVMDYDEEKIQYIVYNLLSNAIKFTPSGSGGKVIFHARQLPANGRHTLQLKVQDTGTGIPPEKLPHIFDRFFQADHSTTRKSDGTGIGLTLTKELVELMGGHISVQSEPGKGTAFTVLLPVTREAPLATQLNTSTNQPVNQSTGQPINQLTNQSIDESTNQEKPVLLLIEDNRDVVTYIESLLKNDYQVETAFDGRAGIEKAFEIVPDIIISDVMMPEKDGYEVCETLKNDARTSHIPIVLLTAKAAEADKVAGLKSGADAYLMKPFHKTELFVRLEQLILLRRMLQERYAGTGFNKTETTPVEPILDDLFIRKIRQTITENIDDTELGIAHLCSAVNLGHTQLFRKMKALTGENPTIYIRKMRLLRAKELLRTTDQSVSEIAYSVGFSDPNYFSRVFSEEFGTAPSAVRK